MSVRVQLAIEDNSYFCTLCMMHTKFDLNLFYGREDKNTCVCEYHMVSNVVLGCLWLLTGGWSLIIMVTEAWPTDCGSHTSQDVH